MTAPLKSPVMHSHLPDFSAIDPAAVKSTIMALLANNKIAIEKLLTQAIPYTWDNLMQPLAHLQCALHQVWSPIAHLHQVMETESLRHAYNETLPLITAYYTQLAQDERLYAAIFSLTSTAEYPLLTAPQQKIIYN